MSVPRAGIALIALLYSSGVAAQSGRAWRPDDRVLVTSFADVGALARDSRRVYAATTGGLVSYDPMTRVWGLPLTLEDGYPANEIPSALAIDEASTDVWLGTAQGSIYRYRAVPPRWDQVGFALGGAVIAIVGGPSFQDDVYVQTASGWFRASRISIGARPVLPGELPPAVIAAARAQRSLDPTLASFRATLGLDQRNRRWPVTAAIPGFTPETYFFGTRGAFFFGFDARRAAPEWFWYGSPARGVSAVAIANDAVWVGADGSGPREGLAQFSNDLQRWVLHDPQDGAPRGPIMEIAASGDDVLAASRDGLYRYHNRRWERLGYEDATSVAASGTSLWVGTRRGLYLDNSGTPQQLLTGTFVNRIRAFGADVWAATKEGMFHIVSSGAGAPYQAQRIDEIGMGNFLDVVSVSDTIIAVGSEGLWTKGATSWRGPLRLPLLAGLGRLLTVRADGAAVWIAGERGVARYTPASGEIISFLAPNDLPSGPVYDVAPAGNYVWLATPLGALRLP